MSGARVLFAVALAGMVGGSCIDQPGDPPQAPPPLVVGESRVVELNAIRLDVSNFEEVVTKQDILALPQSVRSNLWLYDLDLTGRSGTPRLLDNAMAQIRALSPDDPALSQAERNMVRLLNMTPDTADLKRTTLEELLSIAPKVGFAAAEVLAEAAGIGVEDPFLPDDAVTLSILEGVIATHPNAQFRPGEKTASNPDGKVPVELGYIPVTLEDAASDMASMSVRFGPYEEAGRYHPGFMVGTTRAQVLADDFRMILKASTNALPFKGVDLTDASRGSVASIGKDSGQLFDFSDPDWLKIEGLNPDAIIERMEFQILEHPELLPAGDSPIPAPLGNSPVWLAPSWTLERIVAQAGYNSFAGRSFSRDYYLAGEPLFELSIEDGWMALETAGNLGSPPPPLYMWDLMAEIAQVRLHDGPDPDNPADGAIPEGEAHTRFVLQDVEIGVTTDHIAEAIRRNLEEDPSGLVSTASALLDQSAGAPDFYYYRPRPDGDPQHAGDWLYYITADDIPTGDDGQPLRDPAGYQTVGFFGDQALTNKLSAKTPVDGDTSHEKLRIEPDDELYCADDQARTYRIKVLAKPSDRRLRLEITRVK